MLGLMSTRVYLIDEHGPTREILARRLESVSDMIVVGSTGDGEEGVRQVEKLRPHLVLLDTKMRRCDGIDLCRRICSSGTAKVAILTSYVDTTERKLAYQAGVSGYLLKDVDTSSLGRWIKLVAGGNSQPAKDEVG